MNPNDVVHLTTWAALECERQRSGERSVGWMVEGWRYAYALSVIQEPLREKDILEIHALVERRVPSGYRTVDVRVGASIKGPWHRVPAEMAKHVAVLEYLDALDVDIWYRDFEEIHPFQDGNGRTGSILWNFLNGTLARPSDPPDFWS